MITACRLAEKASRQHARVYLHATSAAQAQRLDELLWTFAQGSFVPHRVVESADERPPDEPVLIGYSLGAAPADCEVLINLDGDMPQLVDACRRVVEVVDNEPGRREQGRARYRLYRERGLQPRVHRL